jgi:type IV fimbrial biogenesis protein FimT
MHHSVQAPPGRPRGFTLVELCVTVAVLVIVLAVAAPSIRRLIDRTSLRASASVVRTDLQYVRSAAAARNEMLWLELQSGPDGSCYSLHDGAQGDCRCTPDGHADCPSSARALKVTGFPSNGAVQVSANVKSLRYDPDRGTVSPTATFTLTSRSGEAVQHTVNVLGRIKTCSPASQVPGYASCKS